MLLSEKSLSSHVPKSKDHLCMRVELITRGVQGGFALPVLNLNLCSAVWREKEDVLKVWGSIRAVAALCQGRWLSAFYVPYVLCKSPGSLN